MARNIGATLSLKDGNFFTNMKKAAASADGLKTNLSGMQKGISSFSGSFKKAAGVVVGAVSATATAAAGAAGYAIKFGDEYQSALNSIGAQTGVSGALLDSFGESMQDIYAGGYGESFDDIAASVSAVAQNADRLDTGSIKELTEDALALRDSFGYEVSESVRAANMLMDQFGMSGKEAMNLITQGVQQGLDKNGDMLDSINEYSVHFKQLGLDAENMFNMLANGAAAGTFSVDKLGDAVKEFGIRVKNGTGDEAFTALGISAEAAKQAFAEGGTAAQDMFKDVNAALFGMDDKVQQNTLGVQLYGTMWEDLGAEGVKALSDIGGEFDRTYESMEQLKDIKYNDLGSALEGLKRLLETDVLLPISQELTPAVGGFVNELRGAFEGGALSGLITGAVSGVVGIVQGIAGAVGKVFDAVKTAIENCRPAIDELIGKLGSIKDAVAGAFESSGTDVIGTLANTVIPALVSVLNKAADAVKFVIDNWNILGPVVKGALAAFLAYKSISGVTDVIGKVGSAVSTFTGNIGGVSKAFGTFKTALMGMQIAKNAGGITTLIKGFKGLSTAGAGLGKSISGLGGIFKGAGSAVTFLTSPVGAAVAVLGLLVAAGIAVYKNWDSIKAWAINLWNTVKTAFEGIKNAVVGAFNTAREAVGGAVETIKTTVSEKFNAVKETMGTVMETARGVVQEKLNNIRAAYEENGGGIQGIAAAAMEGVKGYFTAGYDFIDQLTGGKLTAIKDTFLSIWEKVKTGVSDIWDGIVNSVKGSINNVIKAMNGMISGAVGGINKLIGGINNISSKVGIPAIPTITAPQIALLASGGILTRATAFGSSGGTTLIGGEAGPEAVLPLNILWRQLAQFADRLTGATPTPAPAAVTNNVYVTVPAGTGRESDTELANKVARRIIEVLDNM